MTSSKTNGMGSFVAIGASHRAATGIYSLVFASVCMCGSVSRAQHNTDLWVGESNGRIDWQANGGLDPGTVYHPLGPVDTFLRGWSDNDPGFDRNTVASDGVELLPHGSQIWLEVVELDPALFAIDGAFEVLEFQGDATYLGNQDLHTHITWFIDRDDPSFDDQLCVWEGTFKLIDTSGHLADSEPFTMLFSNVTVRGDSGSPLTGPASGDFERDFDVDRDDAHAFTVCMNGPKKRPTPDDPSVTTCEVDCFNAFDFDDGLDIDLLDFAGLQRNYDPR